MSWTRPSATGQGPCPRCAHTTVYHGGRLLVYGGWNGMRMLSDVFALSLDTLRWHRQEVNGDPPSPRAGHSAAVSRSRLVIFGGGDGTLYLNDLWLLDIATAQWSQGFTSGTTPCARSRHSATLLQGGARMIVFGGGDDLRVYNDLYSLDVDAMTWCRVALAQSSAPPPSPRWGHAAVALGDRVLVCGGHDGSSMLNDLHVFDVSSSAWSPVRIEDPACAPSPRAGHTLCALASGTVVLFGGGDGEKVLNDMWFLEPVPGRPDTYRWVLAALTAAVPTGRCAHTATMTVGEANEPDTAVGSVLVVFGGGDGSRRFKDVYIIDPAKVLNESKAKVAAHASVPPETTSQKQQQQHQQVPAVPPPVASSSRASDSSGTSSSLQQAQSVDSQRQATQQQPQHQSKKAPAPSALRVRNPINNSDVGAFLHSLGLEGYAPAFIREDITIETLPMLSERHLEALGITSLGARLRILGAIRRTYGHTSTSNSLSSSSGGSAAGSGNGGAGAGGSGGGSGSCVGLPQSPRSLGAIAAIDSHVAALIAVSERLEGATVALTEAVSALNAAMARQSVPSSPQLQQPKKQRKPQQAHTAPTPPTTPPPSQPTQLQQRMSPPLATGEPAVDSKPVLQMPMPNPLQQSSPPGTTQRNASPKSPKQQREPSEHQQQK